MPLIIYQPKSLHDIALIIFNCSEIKPKISNKGDLTFMKVDGVLVGVNLKNASKHLVLQKGAHTLSEEQHNILTKMGLDIKYNKSNFIIGTIIEREVHPKSNKLFVLKINAHKTIQIVTNSLTALVGKIVVIARVGATLPSGMPITDSKIMNVKSEGMLVSTNTLNIPSNEKGVLILTKGKNGDYFCF